MTILLTGGTGKTARRIAHLLSSSLFPSHHPIVASRNPTQAETVKFDWLDESTFSNPFSHPQSSKSPITAVYLVQPPVNDPFPHVKAFIDYALQKGVKRFVFLSASSIPAGSPMHGQTHAYLEQLGKEDRVQWAVLRPTWFMENLSEGHHLNTIRENNTIFTATQAGRVPFVSATDIAAVAVHALTNEEPPNTDYFIVGPELLSYDEIAAQLSTLLERQITHKSLSVPELVEHLQNIGIPKEYAAMLAGLDAIIAEDKEEISNDVVEETTGRRPVRFVDWARELKATWEPSN